jgi:2-keto-4-pentenoate hydratase/2-oxohepta-3-ene-1,7-dioic acid hydratase in catechol pathway
MKVAYYRQDGRARVGVVVGESVHEVPGRPTVAALLAGGEGALSEAERAASGPGAPLDSVELLPTMQGADKFICVGRNYLEHVKEGGREVPKFPVLFSRYWSSVVGHGQPLLRPVLSEQFDYEGELCAVIGRECRYVPQDRALEVVGGYTILQEGSIRDWQLRAPTQMAGKNFLHSGAMGPWLVTSDEIPDPHNLRLVTRLNGEVMQDDNTGGMLYDVSFLVCYISQFMPLLPGDLIATGTPPGVGFARKPPVWLRAGDRLEVEIERIGRLENTVQDEPESPEALASSWRSVPA